MSARTHLFSLLIVATVLAGCSPAPAPDLPTPTASTRERDAGATLTEADATYAKNAYAVYLATSDALYTDQTLQYEHLTPLVSAELFDEFVAEVEQIRQSGSNASGGSRILEIEAEGLDDGRVEISGCIDVDRVFAEESGLMVTPRGNGPHAFVAVLERTDDWFMVVSDERLADTC